jgi:hypothetical protein
MKLVYLAHPLGAPTKEGILRNLAQAKLWYKWASDHYWPDHVFNMGWVLNCEVYDDASPEDRDRGMQRNYQHILRCDELWLLGPTVSSGMEDEAKFARRCPMPVFDLTNEMANPLTAPLLNPRNMMQWKATSLSQQALDFSSRG